MPPPDPAVALRELRARTEERLTELTNAFNAILESSDAANLDDEHDPEGATVGFERAQLSSLLERARAHLAEIDAALDRAHRGHYGLCEGCGRPIATERLEAQPATRICISCAVR